MKDGSNPLVVDADGHVLEPADLWVKNLPAKFKGLALRIYSDPKAQGEGVMIEQDTIIAPAPNAAAMGPARWPKEQLYNFRGRSYNEGAPAGFDPKLRVAENDREGIDIAVLYPTLGLFLNGIRDLEQADLACRIYNDWLADFCRYAPERFVGIAILPWQDPPAAARELRRAVSELDFRGAFMRPNAYNQYFVHDPEFDAVWAEAQDLGVPVGIHPGGTAEVWGAPQVYARFHNYKPRRLMPGFKNTTFLFDNYLALTLLVGTGVLERFPRLKILMLESGGGWLPHWLDQMDHEGEFAPIQRKGLSLKPSEYFKRQCYISGDPDDSSYRFLPGLIGAERMVWASDFPHTDVTVPSVTQELRKNLEGVDPAVQRKILGENAVAIYGLKPPSRG